MLPFPSWICFFHPSVLKLDVLWVLPNFYFLSTSFPLAIFFISQSHCCVSNSHLKSPSAYFFLQIFINISNWRLNISTRMSRFLAELIPKLLNCSICHFCSIAGIGLIKCSNNHLISWAYLKPSSTSLHLICQVMLSQNFRVFHITFSSPISISSTTILITSYYGIAIAP